MKCAVNFGERTITALPPWGVHTYTIREPDKRWPTEGIEMTEYPCEVIEYLGSPCYVLPESATGIRTEIQQAVRDALLASPTRVWWTYSRIKSIKTPTASEIAFFQNEKWGPSFCYFAKINGYLVINRAYLHRDRTMLEPPINPNHYTRELYWKDTEHEYLAREAL